MAENKGSPSGGEREAHLNRQHVQQRYDANHQYDANRASNRTTEEAGTGTASASGLATTAGQPGASQSTEHRQSEAPSGVGSTPLAQAGGAAPGISTAPNEAGAGTGARGQQASAPGTSPSASGTSPRKEDHAGKAGRDDSR
jgi:hypothetical protein